MVCVRMCAEYKETHYIGDTTLSISEFDNWLQLLRKIECAPPRAPRAPFSQALPPSVLVRPRPVQTATAELLRPACHGASRPFLSPLDSGREIRGEYLGTGIATTGGTTLVAMWSPGAPHCQLHPQ